MNVGVPQFPRVIFMSGDISYLVKQTPIKKWGNRFIRLELILEDSVKNRYDIDDDDLDYEVTEYGTITREYPAEYIKVLSENIEQPLVIMWCNFDGTMNIDSEIQDIKSQLIRKNNTIEVLKSENEELREQLLEAKSHIRAVGGKNGIR
jgi:hypothetical protein